MAACATYASMTKSRSYSRTTTPCHNATDGDTWRISPNYTSLINRRHLRSKVDQKVAYHVQGAPTSCIYSSAIVVVVIIIITIILLLLIIPIIVITITLRITPAPRLWAALCMYTFRPPLHSSKPYDTDLRYLVTSDK